MKKFIERLKLFDRSHRLFGIAILFLWIKTYIVSRFVFDLPIENVIEEFILFISPLGALIILYSFALIFKRTISNRWIMFVSIIASFLLYANIVYYRFFDDFITVPVLLQFKNFGDLGGSAKNLMMGWDLTLFIDVVILFILARRSSFKSITFKKGSRRFIFAATTAILFLNISLAESQRPQLLTRAFDREMLVKYLNIYSYHFYDALVHSKTSAQKAFAEDNDIVEVENYVNNNNPKNQTNDFTGIAKGKNVILVSMESLQNFVINYQVNGQEVTPFLNELVKDSFYFSNIYHQTGQGKTSDAEFLIDNSLYPLPRGAVYTTNSSNKYHATPEILKKNGYTSVALHGNNKSFWNRDIMYRTLGYDTYFAEQYYDVTPENSVNYGLKDIPFFQQSMPLLKQLQQPFYAKFLTLTNHYPYTLDEEDKMIPALTTGDGSVDRYVQTARYLDESLKVFFDELKANGFYDNSIIVMYGDHYGISANHNKAMAQVIGAEITPYEHVNLQEVPLIIHIPGVQGKEMQTIGGQIDIKPTILNLLGIHPGNDIQFGKDLFDPNREEIAIFRDGSVVTDQYIYTEGTCYRYETGIKVDDKAECDEQRLIGENELSLSDKVIGLDLLRFLDTGANPKTDKKIEKNNSIK